jgi:TolA-binding protein
MRKTALYTAIVIILAAILATAGYYIFRPRDRVMMNQATAAIDDGYPGAAVEYLTRVVVEHPDSPLVPEALFMRGSVYQLYQSQHVEAVTDFRELLERYPEHGHAREARQALATIFEKKVGNCRQAIVEYQRLIDDFERDEEDDLYQFRIARCFFELFNFEQAKLEFATLIKLYPDSDYVDDAYFNIANILQTQGALEEAKKSWALFLSRYPDSELSIDARFNLAATLEENEELEEALKLFQALFDDYPNEEAITWRIEKVRDRLKVRGR